MSTEAAPAPPPAPAPDAAADAAPEAEVYAASAAESALRDGKPTPDDVDLSALALEPAGDSTPAEAEPERVLSKEEMVEEALNCPCIAAMRDGPCGDSFVAAYRCFLESETEPKGMDCMDQFTSMQGCMAEHPDEYNLDDDEEDPFTAAKGDGKGEAATETVKTEADQAEEKGEAVPAAESPPPPTQPSVSASA